MEKKIVKNYLLITFSIMVLFWGFCLILSKVLNISLNDNMFLGFLYFAGGMSPAIASYISLRRCNKVKNIKEWLKKIFDFKHNVLVYLLVILFVIIYFTLGCFISGFKMGDPIYMVFILTPLMLFGGGSEETGWRMILQPELEKKYNFYISTIIVGVIWWLWHGLLFFIEGANTNMNYLFFGMMCISLSFALATIRKISNGVFPCILLHCLINALSGIYIFNFTLLSSAITTITMIVVSILALHFNKNKITK